MAPRVSVLPLDRRPPGRTVREKNFAALVDAAKVIEMQTEELAYAIVTPYSMSKSRTGGIVGRLISRTGLDLVAGRMFAPGAELAKRYADRIVTETDPRHRATQELIRQYILKNFTGEKNGQRPRVLFLIFRGPDAVEKIHRTVGHIVHERTSGETIRDTYGDYITDDSGNVTYFEPGVLAAFDPKAVVLIRRTRTSKRHSSSSSQIISSFQICGQAV